MLGLTDNESEWKANNNPGIHYFNIEDERNRVRILRSIKQLQKENNIIIVSRR
jgi:hypothetical protein